MTKYLLGELLGRGGMGQVHSARDRYGKAVVVKRLRNTLAGDRLMAARFMNEAQLAERVAHPNVIKVLDKGEAEDGSPYLVMDRAHGISLGKAIDRDGPFAVERALRVAAQLLEGLQAIHDARVVHADMKSSNVLIDDADRVTIIDFGLARTLTKEPERTGMVAGTPAFMAPEVITGAPPTAAADIYAVGVMLYEMLTGNTPFAGSSDIFDAHLHEVAISPSLRAPEQNIPAAIDRMVLRALEKSPAARWLNVREFALAVEDALAAEQMITTMDIWAARTTMRREGSNVPATTVDFGASKNTVRREKAARLPTPMPPAADDSAPELPLVSKRNTRDTVQPHDVISAALERAQQLIENRSARAAVTELESTLAMLTPDIASEMPMAAETWRIQTVLAALYDGLGKKERARRLALVAYKNALRTGCKLAEARTKALIERFEQQKRPASRVRFAKGSSQFQRTKR